MIVKLMGVLLSTNALLAGTDTGSTHPAPEPSGSNRPNIIIFLADDMGFSDAGCYGSEIATPNIDRLAASGLRFTRFYNSARCCPTRAALLTGKYPHECGIGHMLDNRGSPGYQGRLSERCVTIAEVLRQAGYRTWMSGKWHLGGKRPEWPIDRGFERYFGQLSGACNYFRPEPNRTMALGDEVYHPPADGFYITDAIADYSLRFLDGSRDGATGGLSASADTGTSASMSAICDPHENQQPFFLYVAFTAPHAPLHALPEDIAKYRGKYRVGWDAVRQQRYRRMRELGIIPPGWPLSSRPAQVPAWENVADKDEQDLRMAVYAAQVDRMDVGIGRIMDRVREMGMERNTLVMFLSDNGSDPEDIDEGKPGAPVDTAESYRGYAAGWANVSNTPFRGFKRQAYEGGIATPLVVQWPAVIRRGGGVTHETGHVIDLMATCLDAAGVAYPKQFGGRRISPSSGVSLLPAFHGQPWHGHDCLFWEHEGNRAARCGQWKLVAVNGGKWELYDIQTDGTEQKNLAGREPWRVESLKSQYEAWAKHCGVLRWEDLPARKR